MNPKNYTLGQLARKYYDMGWNIIPLFDNSKNPATGAKLMLSGGWLEYQKRRITEEEFKRFFIDNSPTGLGVITGKISGIVVVDEDSYKKDGMKFEIDSPLKVRTASGGHHYYFKYADAVKTTGYSKGINIEIKSDGGFVVLPPSTVTSKQGFLSSYEWESALDVPLPTISEAQLTKYKPQGGSQIDLHDVLNAASGSRHNDLRTFALMMFNRFKKEEWDVAQSLVRDENKKLKEPLPVNEINRIIKDSMNFVFKNPVDKGPSPIFVDKVDQKLNIYTGAQAEELYDKKQTAYGGGISTGYPRLDEYFKFLPEQLYMLSAATHIGKTTFAVNMAANISRMGKNVLFASLEQGIYIVPRVKSVLGVKNMPLTFSILDSDGFPSVDDFIKMISGMDTKPDVLFLDHLHYFARGGNKASEEIDRIVVEIQVMAKKLQLPILLISHVRKLNGSKIPTMDDMKDSVSLSQIPAVVMLLHRGMTDPDLQITGQGIYEQEGILFINKNRIQGKTGSLKIRVEDSGIINFI